MKKRKLIARIIACVLALILILGLIMPVVSATEIDDESLSPLPEGFEYIENGEGSYVIRKSDDNNKIAFQLSGYYEGFDTSLVSIFIGNLETKETTIVPLSKPHYLGSVDLKEGYYVIFNGGYAWSDKDGITYALGDYEYFYVGDNFEYGKFVGVDFAQDTSEILSVNISPSNNSALETIKYNDSPAISNETIVFPLNSIPPSGNGNDATEDNNGDQSNSTVVPGENSGDSGNEGNGDGNNSNAFTILLDAVKNSFVLILIIVALYIIVTIRKVKRDNALSKQSENDKYDDKRVD